MTGGLRHAMIRPGHELTMHNRSTLSTGRMLQNQPAHTIVVQVIDTFIANLERIIIDLHSLTLVQRPVLGALDFPLLDHFGGHGNDKHALLPHHSPEVVYGLVQRALCAYVGVLLLVAVHEVGVNVVAAHVFVIVVNIF